MHQTTITSAAAIFEDLHAVQQRKPIIHNITNYVVMQTTANMLLALGAAPIMAHAEAELNDIVGLANALVINIGTLDDAWLRAIECAQHAALARSIPIIFDPVGAGASTYRTHAAQAILARGVTIVRGNASEIMALAALTSATTAGVESTAASQAALRSAEQLAQNFNCVVVISGAIDIIVHSTRKVYNPHGTPLFTRVTGMGCTATALIGAFAAINSDYFMAAAHAMTLFSIAGELAAQHAHAPGSFQIALIDLLYALPPTAFEQLRLSTSL